MARLPARGKESRSGSLVVSGLVAAALCIAIGAFANQWLSKPDPQVQPASAPREAILSSLPDPAPPRSDLARTIPAPVLAEPERALSDLTGPELEPTRPELELRRPQLAPSFALAPEFEDLVLVPRAEVQAVAGTQPPDAGSSATLAEAARAPAADAGAAPAITPAATVADSELDAAPIPDPAGAPADEACGLITCAAGYACCNASCGVCVAPGDDCDPAPCDRKIQNPISQLCGRSTCNVGEVCCNPSCGTCVAPEESCDPTPCDNAIQYPVSVMCGRSTCSVGQVCCNPSCGTCVAPGETCSPNRCD